MINIQNSTTFPCTSKDQKKLQKHLKWYQNIVKDPQEYKQNMQDLHTENHEMLLKVNKEELN